MHTNISKNKQINQFDNFVTNGLQILITQPNTNILQKEKLQMLTAIILCFFFPNYMYLQANNKEKANARLTAYICNNI